MQSQCATRLNTDVTAPAVERETLIRVEQQSCEQLGVLAQMIEEIASKLSGPEPTDNAKVLGAPIPSGAIGLAHEIRSKIYQLSERAQHILNEI